MGGNPTHDSAPHHPFRILDGNAPFTAFHKDDAADNCQHEAEKQKEHQEIPGVIDEDLFIKVGRGPRQPHHDAGENQQRHPVADAARGDLFAQPHNKNGPRRQRQHGGENESRARMIDQSDPLAVCFSRAIAMPKAWNALNPTVIQRV